MNNCIGINLWNWVDGISPACAGLPAKLAQMGFTAIELPMTQPELSPELLREVRKCGLEVALCAAMLPGRDLSNFNAQVRENTMDYLNRCLKTAEQTGAKLLVGPLYAGGGKRHRLSADNTAREWDLAVAGLRTLARRAGDSGVHLALEPINRYRTSVVNTMTQAMRMVDEIGCVNVGVHFDTYQANIEENDFLGALETALQSGRMFHLHACGNDRGIPGQGHLPWSDIFALLRRYAYGRHITMETFAPGGMDAGWIDPPETPDEVARQGLDYLRRAVL